MATVAWPRMSCQLPSVGPGRVLADIIGSAVVPTARLTKSRGA